MQYPKATSLATSTQTFFRPISYKLNKLLDRWELTPEMGMVITALIVGIGTGLGAVAFRYLIQAVAWVGFDLIPQLTSQWGKAYVIFVPAIGGLLVGAIALIFPQVMGVGYDSINMALYGNMVWYIALALIFMKIIATSITLGSGGGSPRRRSARRRYR